MPTMPSAFGNVARDGYQGTTPRTGSKAASSSSSSRRSLTHSRSTKLGDTYYAARSNEFGYANYEIIAAPQIAVNPLTAITNQFSTELGLNQQQKGQILPILNDEIAQLQALQGNTSLSGAKKLEQLRGIGVSFDEKVKPLLNPQQQVKFQALRDALRARVLGKIAEGAGAKLEAAADAHLEAMQQDLQSAKAKLEKAWL
jgi:hypothetical protein